MRAVFLGLFLLFKSQICVLEEQHLFNGDIRDFVFGKEKVFVVTDSQLLQLGLDLTEEKHKDISSNTYPNRVNILVPFEANETLVACGTADDGYCEVLDINDITRSIYWEKDISAGPPVNGSSVAFLVNFKKEDPQNGTYMLVARETPEGEEDGKVTLRSTLHFQPGEIFSASDSVSTKVDIHTPRVEWIDGFQTSSPSHSYLLVNVKSEKDPAVVVLRMKNSEKKSDMAKSLQGARLQCCDDKPRRKLLSSSAVESSGSLLLWVGIFTAQKVHDPENTALALYDLSQLPDQVPSDFSCRPDCEAQKGDNILSPRSVVFKHSSMTSVAAEKDGSWTVIYIGTANGQLMKIVLGKTFNSGCATVLYKSNDDRMVFPRMYVMDHKYIYMALKNQIRRVPVTLCSAFSTLRDCRASQDPSCGWCVTTNKCCTQDECSDSIWIPADFFQEGLITFQAAEVSTGVSLNLNLKAQGTGSPHFKCSIKSGHVDLCDSPSSVFPSCSCSFSKEHLPSEVTATVTIGDQKITESRTLRSCPDITETSPYARCLFCVSAGCLWSSVSQKCSWAYSSALQLHSQDTCKETSSEKYTPQILSVLPNQVSFHGKNNATIKGKNLEAVIKIRFKGSTMDCDLKEFPVLDRSSDALMFNIPTGYKGSVRVCVLTADGLCHSSAVITYESSPTCTGLQPRTTWTSGGRKIRVLGSGLEYVEKITVNDQEMSVQSSTAGLWFHSLPLWVSEGSFSVSLRVGNSTVHCVDKLSYLPNPEFFSFSTDQDVNYVSVYINKKQDGLKMSQEDVKVWGLQEEQQFECRVQKIISTIITCNILGTQDVKINVTSLKIRFGNISTILKTQQSHMDSLFCV